jgi:hypothetical protein
MCQDDGSGVRDDRQTEDFAWVNEEGVEGAGADELVALHTPSRVKDEHDETFTLGVEEGIAGDVQAPIFHGFIRCIAELEGGRGRALAKRHDLVL